jgi:AcrR family transcriptional regulator
VAPTGARLSREARRDQLVTLGHDLVAASSFEEVSVDDVAAAAGISRGLLFHYFPTKRDFQVAVAERAAEELLAATEPDPDAAPLEQLRRGTERFLDHVAPRRAAYLSLVRGAGSGEPALRTVNERTRDVLVRRVVDGLALDPVPPVLTLIVRGWVAACEEIVVSWLVDDELTRDRLVDLLVEILLLQLSGSLDEDELARVLGTA